MKIYFSTQIIINDGQIDSLNKVGGHNRLLSYMYLKNIMIKGLKEFLKTGILNEDIFGRKRI